MTILNVVDKFEGSRNDEMARTGSLTNIFKDSDTYFWIPSSTLQLKCMVDVCHKFYFTK